LRARACGPAVRMFRILSSRAKRTNRGADLRDTPRSALSSVKLKATVAQLIRHAWLSALACLSGAFLVFSAPVYSQTGEAPPPSPNSTEKKTDDTSGKTTQQTATAPQSDSSDSSAEPKKPEPPPAYKLLRYEEDYSFLKDPARRTDFWDPIKYIPFWGWDDWYLSFGGDIRERFEFYRNQDAGSGPGDANGDNGYMLQRYMLHLDAHLGRYIRLYGEYVSGLEDGRIGGPRPQIDQDVFDVHQAFADFMLPLRSEHDSLMFRVGRQEFEYGSGRLIDLRDGPTLRLSFDSARMLLHTHDWQIDSWWAKPVDDNPGVCDDVSDPHQSFWGLYATHPLPIVKDAGIDLYYLGFENHHAVYAQGAGYELRNSLGTRIWGKPKPWEFNLEYVWQFGSFGSGEIEAWTAANAIRYNFSDLPLKPRVGIRFDIASGDDNPKSPNLNTFNPLFPSGVYFNLLNPVGPLNMIDLHPTIDLYLSKKITFSFDWDFFWRESLGDGVYRISGSVLRPAGGSARYVGNSPAFTLGWNATRHASILAQYVHFFPGPFFEQNPPDRETDYLTTWLSYKF